jgi:hypothetical protein
VAERLIGLLEADAAVHGRERRLRGQRHGFVRPYVLTTGGDQPDISAHRADGVDVVE